MRWNELDTAACPVARTLSVIGDRWTILILRDALRGVSRFDAFQARLGCSRPIVADRLHALVQRGVLSREAYEQHPPRYDYRLTDMGRTLAPVLMVMAQWGETQLPVANGYKVQRVHKACGHTFQPVMHCSECGEPLLPGQVEHVDPHKAKAAASA